MASPVGHSLIGLAMADTGDRRFNGWWYLLALLAVNFADLDFLPGLLVGDINRFHRSVTHSLVAALIFGLTVALIAWLLNARAVRAGLLGAGLYLSHLLLDFLSGNPSEASGQPILWPFVTDDVMSPWSPLAGVFHGGPGDGFLQFLDFLVSWQNFELILVELLVFSPFLLLARLRRRVVSTDYTGLRVQPRSSKPEGNM